MKKYPFIIIEFPPFGRNHKANQLNVHLLKLKTVQVKHVLNKRIVIHTCILKVRLFIYQ